MKNKSNLMKNMVSYAILQIVNLLVGLLLPRLFLEIYGSEVNGVISTINSFTSYFAYLEAGLGVTLIHSLFKPLSSNDDKSINNILSYAKKQYKKISLIYFVMVLVLSIFFPFIRSVDGLETGEFISLVFVVGIYGAIDFYTMSKYRVLLTADGKEYVISLAMTIAQVVRFILVWILLKNNSNVVVVKMMPILTLLLRSLILKIYVKKRYSNISFTSTTDIDKGMIGNRWDALLLQISITTSTALPTIIISQILGYKEANVFAVYSLVINAVISIISALSSGMAPMLGKSISRGENVSKIYKIYSHFVIMVICIILSVTVIMILPFINIYVDVVNDVKYIYTEYAILFSIWGALFLSRIPTTAIVNSAGLYKENRNNNIINLISQAILYLVCTIFWGIKGLLISMIITTIHRNISMEKVNDKFVLHTGIIKNIIKNIIMVAIIILNFLIFNDYIFNTVLDFSTWIIVSLIIFIIETIVSLIVFSLVDYKLTKELIILIINKIKKK